ncbi:hypothetical protein [Dictyobacter vulcani]|uniref:hypothetical protein n=1 Tax=Dictyobacter vulcani TaxID=2607529 RepID=UPI0012500768|nr:hypothetical protein [Dictyobacter vulcani]
MPVAPTPRRILCRDPLREGRGGSTRSPTTLRCEQATAHTIPVGATALRVVLARWPAQTQHCESFLHAGLRKRSSAAFACGALSTYTTPRHTVEVISFNETYWP